MGGRGGGGNSLTHSSILIQICDIAELDPLMSHMIITDFDDNITFVCRIKFLKSYLTLDEAFPFCFPCDEMMSFCKSEVQ